MTGLRCPRTVGAGVPSGLSVEAAEASFGPDPQIPASAHRGPRSGLGPLRSRLPGPHGVGEIADPALVPTQVANLLAQDIIFGRIAPDARVVEEEIAARFGVSRSPVRESIRLLERDGLVRRFERRGARVSPLTRQDLDEVYVCRLGLERIAAVEAAVRRTPDDLRRLGEALERLRSALGRAGEVEAYSEANLAYTAAIHVASANATLARLLEGLVKQSLRYRVFAYRSFPELMETSLQRRIDIVAAIEAGDAEAAWFWTEDLLRATWQAVRPCLPE